MIAKCRKADRGLALAVSLLAELGMVTLTNAQVSGADGASRAGRPGGKAARAETPSNGRRWDLQQTIKRAEARNQWAAYDLWNTYHRGRHGIHPDPAKADEWLRKFVRNMWLVRFRPVDGFAPTSPGQFLARIHQHSASRSGRTSIGTANFFRTTKQGDRLIGSFLSNYPNQLKASPAKVPGVKVISVERITPKEFIQYEQSHQESL